MDIGGGGGIAQYACTYNFPNIYIAWKTANFAVRPLLHTKKHKPTYTCTINTGKIIIVLSNGDVQSQ